MDLKKLYEDLNKMFENAILDYKEKEKELYMYIKPSKFRDICIYLNIDKGYALTSMFANDEESINKNIMIYSVFASREDGFFVIPMMEVKREENTFISVGDKVHAASRYEREIMDTFGLVAVGHPDPRPMIFHGNWPSGNSPLLKKFDSSYKPDFVNEKQKFTKVKGEDVYEIPVGPVHAGIIEPGHFRFSVSGEYIINLEAHLGFVHKGIEKLAEGMSIDRCFYLAERISGDETFANSLAYCQAVEKIAGVEISQKAKIGRVVFAELERITSHLGDLAGICVDVAYGFAAFQFRMLRGWAYLLADELCGMRFLRSVNLPGGLRKDFILGKEQKIIDYLTKIEKELWDTKDIIFSNGLFTDRIERIGVLGRNIAIDLNASGPPARATGISYDVRKTFPYAAYGSLKFEVPDHHLGDINCRMKVKLEEVFISIGIILQCIENKNQGPVIVPIGDLPPYESALGYTESPRGENIHWLMTGQKNTVFRYKIRTPSFCNWPALCYAVNGNIVPDFPLINKSFNLSYAGNDL